MEQDETLAAVESAAAESVYVENRMVGQRCRAVHRLHLQHERAFLSALEEAEFHDPVWERLDPMDHTCQSLVATTGVTYSRAAEIVLLAQDVNDWAPAVLDALDSGVLCERIAMLLCGRVRDLDEERRTDVIAEVVRDHLERLRAGERPNRRAILANADRVAARIDPDGVERRRREARRSRSVRFRPEADGMCTMTARLGAEQAASLAERIDAAAGRAGPGDHRSLEQRRADALAALASGCHTIYDPATDSTGAPTGSRPTATSDAQQHGAAQAPVPAPPEGSPTPIVVSPVLRPQVTVVATGVGAPRVEFARTGEAAVDTLVRLLATARGATFQVTDTRSGTMDSPASAHRYEVSPALRRRIRSRDGTCRHPGCAVPAERCDIDHVVPFDREHPQNGGLTVESNLICLCRRHHRYKTFSGAHYEFGPRARVSVRIGRHVLTTDPNGPLGRPMPPAGVPAPETSRTRPADRASGPPSDDRRDDPDDEPPF